MSNFDKTQDLFSSPYLTVLGKAAGRAPLELPDRKNNFKYTRQNLQKTDKDDKMHEDDINHITYFGSPTNIIDLDAYLAVGHNYQKIFTYIFYSDMPTPTSQDHIFTDPLYTYAYPPVIGKWWRRVINSRKEYDESNMSELVEQLVGEPFEQFKWPGIWHIFKPDKNSEIGSFEEVCSSYVNITDDTLWNKASTVSSMVSVELMNPPGRFPSDVPLYDDKFNVYRYKHELTGYSVNESGDSFLTSSYELTHWFRGVLRELTYEIPDVFTEENFKNKEVVFDQYLWPHSGIAYGSNENGADFSETEDVHRLWYIASSVFINETQPSAYRFVVDDFNEHTIDSSYTISSIMPFTQYIDDYEDTRFYNDLNSINTPIDEQVLGTDYLSSMQDDSVASGKFYKLFHINDFFNNDLIESSFVSGKLKDRYIGNAYGSSVSGANFNETEDVYHLFWRSSIDVLAPPDLPSSNAKFYNDHGAVWEQYIASGTNVGFKYENSEEIEQIDNGSAFFSGAFTQIYYLSANYDDPPYYISGINILSSWEWEPIREHYKLTRYAADSIGSDIIVESGTVEDIISHWYRIDLDVFDNPGMNSGQLLSKYSNKWAQYVTSSEIDVWKHEDEPDANAVAINPEYADGVHGISSMFNYMPGWLDEALITSFVKWDSAMQDAFALMNVAFTNNHTEIINHPERGNGGSTITYAMTDGVSGITLRETAPNSNIFIVEDGTKDAYGIAAEGTTTKDADPRYIRLAFDHPSNPSQGSCFNVPTAYPYSKEGYGSDFEFYMTACDDLRDVFEEDLGHNEKSGVNSIGFTRNSIALDSFYSNSFIIYGVSGAYYKATSGGAAFDEPLTLTEYNDCQLIYPHDDLKIVLGEMQYNNEDMKDGESYEDKINEFNLSKNLYSGVKSAANTEIYKSLGGSHKKSGFEFTRNYANPTTLASSNSDLWQDIGLDSQDDVTWEAGKYELYTMNENAENLSMNGPYLYIKNLDYDSSYGGFTKELYLKIGSAHLSGVLVYPNQPDEANIDIKTKTADMIYGASLGCYRIGNTTAISNEDVLYMIIYKTIPILHKDTFNSHFV